MEITESAFATLVQETLDAIPEPFASRLSSVPVIIVTAAPEPGLLGRYTGIPLPERDGPDPVTPSVIEIFMSSLVARSPDLDSLRDEVRITVLHELGHHLGMDEDDLDRLGYA